MTANRSPQCQVEGCVTDMKAEKGYNQKKRCCAAHMRADAVRKRGTGNKLFRFCFQCGKLESLSRFDGAHRTCRDRLVKRKERQAALKPSGFPSDVQPQHLPDEDCATKVLTATNSSSQEQLAADAADIPMPSTCTQHHLLQQQQQAVAVDGVAPTACWKLSGTASDLSEQLLLYSADQMSGQLPSLVPPSTAQPPAVRAPAANGAMSAIPADPHYEQMLDQLMLAIEEQGVVFVDSDEPDAGRAGEGVSAHDDKQAAQLAKLLEQELAAALLQYPQATAGQSAAGHATDDVHQMKPEQHPLQQMRCNMLGQACPEYCSVGTCGCDEPARFMLQTLEQYSNLPNPSVGPARVAAVPVDATMALDNVVVGVPAWHWARLDLLKQQFHQLHSTLKQLQAGVMHMKVLQQSCH